MTGCYDMTSKLCDCGMTEGACTGDTKTWMTTCSSCGGVAAGAAMMQTGLPIPFLVVIAIGTAAAGVV